MQSLAIDLGARKPHTDDRWPGVTFVLRVLPATVSLFCRDKAKHFDEDGTIQFMDNRYFSWLFRFGVESIEGPVGIAHADPFLTEYIIGDTSYPIISTSWFDQIHPLGVRAVGQVVGKWNRLGAEVKKKSDSPPGGDEVSAGTSGGTAGDVTSASVETTDTTKLAALRST